MKRFLSSIFCLFIISAIDIAACQAQQRPAKLASIYFGKSKFSLNDILATKGKESALNALSKKEKPTINKEGEWQRIILKP